MLSQVTVTNTINVTTILSVIAAMGLIATPLIFLLFKIVRSVLKEIFDLKVWIATYQSDLTSRQTAEIEECIHKIPGHPENRTAESSPPATQPGG